MVINLWYYRSDALDIFFYYSDILLHAVESIYNLWLMDTCYFKIRISK